MIRSNEAIRRTWFWAQTMLFDGSRKWVLKPPSRPGTWSVCSQYATLGLLLSSQTTNQEPTVRIVGLPELEMRIKINEPLRRKSAIATTEKQQKETPILRWKNGPLFWVPYWKRNSAQCQHRKRTPKRGPFFGPQNGVRLLVKLWGLFLRRFCAWHAPGLFEYEILCRPTFLIWLMVFCLAIYQPRANICNSISEDMPERECQKICQKKTGKYARKERQKICEGIC